MLFHCTPERIGGLDFLLDAPVEATASDRTRTGSEPGDELGAVLEALQRCALDAIVVDVTLPEIAAAGLRVVRAIVPGLIPLTFGARLRRRACAALSCPGPRYRTSPLREDQGTNAASLRVTDRCQHQAGIIDTAPTTSRTHLGCEKTHVHSAQGHRRAGPLVSGW